MGGWEGSVRRSKCRRRRWLAQAQGKVGERKEARPGVLALLLESLLSS